MAAIRYIVTDVDASVAFHVDVLGFELVERWGPPFAMVRHGDTVLWLSGPGSSAARPLVDGRTPAPGGWSRLVLEIADLPAQVDKLKRSGAQFRERDRGGTGRPAGAGRRSLGQSRRAFRAQR